jgi:CNP1-like family protein
VRGLALSLAAALAAAACSTTKPQEQSDWERRNPQGVVTTEEEVDPPAYPVAKNLVQFSVPEADGFRFFIDRASLSVSKEGLVRYVLVARSPEGVDNVSFEGLRCASAEQRLYALARPDRSWTAARSTWRPASSPRHLSLVRDYFCPQSEPIRNASEGILALEGGGHPFARGFAGEPVRRGR